MLKFTRPAIYSSQTYFFSNKTDLIIEVPVKKKRGRPRKVDLIPAIKIEIPPTVEIIVPEVVEVKEKKKRVSKPRKIKEAEKVSILVEETVLVVEKKVEPL